MDMQLYPPNRMAICHFFMLFRPVFFLVEVAGNCDLNGEKPTCLMVVNIDTSRYELDEGKSDALLSLSSCRHNMRFGFFQNNPIMF